jgi:hypothetical protein
MKYKFALWFYAGVSHAFQCMARCAENCAFRTGRRAARANLRLLNLPTSDR